MKLLFIDHECHRRTRSADFFIAILRKTFEVKEHYYSRYYHAESESAAKACDVAVIWEFPISRSSFFFPGKRNVFVPMYDNEWASYWQWKRIAWSGMGVVSFCDKVTEHARRCGVTNILDVRYFPDPAKLPQGKGDPKRVFLWERGDIGKAVAGKLFPPEAGYVFDIKGKDEFLAHEEYLARLAKCGIVIAPRRREGIGMAFLEAMAMGKCVVANDDATMNEYITDGETGILFDADNPTPISDEMVAHVRENVASCAARLHEKWLGAATSINDFLLRQQPCNPSFATWLKIAFSFPLFLVEGAFHVLAERCSAVKSGGQA